MTIEEGITAIVVTTSTRSTDIGLAGGAAVAWYSTSRFFDFWRRGEKQTCIITTILWVLLSTTMSLPTKKGKQIPLSNQRMTTAQPVFLNRYTLIQATRKRSYTFCLLDCMVVVHLVLMMTMTAVPVVQSRRRINHCSPLMMSRGPFPQKP